VFGAADVVGSYARLAMTAADVPEAPSGDVELADAPCRYPVCNAMLKTAGGKSAQDSSTEEHPAHGQR
jgi:hypothetical protein